MTDGAALYRLLTWSSPAYPIGAFSYSHGLEWAVEAGWVTDETTLVAWVAHMLRHGPGMIDLAILAASFRAATRGDLAALSQLADEAQAWRGSAETWLEATQPGQAFLDVTRAAWPNAQLDTIVAALGDRAIVQSLAVGIAAATAGVTLGDALLSYAHGFTANLVSAGVRLIPLGQTAGQRAQAALLAVVTEAADAAVSAELDQLGSAAPLVDIAAMRHETQYTRLFRS